MSRPLPFGPAVLIGEGQVGQLMRSVISGEVESLTIVDVLPPPSDQTEDGVRRMVGDITEPFGASLRSLLATADLVVCALPEDALVTCLPELLATVSADALVVDTASVKSLLPAVWTADGPSILSINPMFAPSLSPAGRPVLAVGADRGTRQEAFLELLRDREMVVVPVPDADKHDRLAALAQTGVHAAAIAFGMTAVASGFTAQQVAAIAPPPCRQQLMLLARMTMQAPEVYEDIQRANPYAEPIRADLGKHLAEVGRLAAERELGSALGSISEWLGAEHSSLAELCQRVFETFMTPPA